MNELVSAEIQARIETLRKNAEFNRGLASQSRVDLATHEAQAAEADALADGYAELLQTNLVADLSAAVGNLEDRLARNSRAAVRTRAAKGTGGKG